MTEDLGAFALLCFTSLLAIINPLSAAPMYLALTAGYTLANRRRTLRNAMLTAFAVLLVFALLGGTIFQLFGITIDAFRIAGGIIFFGIGMDMLRHHAPAGQPGLSGIELCWTKAMEIAREQCRREDELPVRII